MWGVWCFPSFLPPVFHPLGGLSRGGPCHHATWVIKMTGWRDLQQGNHPPLRRSTRLWFQNFLFSPLPGEMIQFDYYFSYGLKPPTSQWWEWCYFLPVRLVSFRFLLEVVLFFGGFFRIFGSWECLVFSLAKKNRVNLITNHGSEDRSQQ